MKLKRTLAACIIFCLLGGGAYAESTKLVPTYDNNTISFAAKVNDGTETFVSVTVLKKGDENTAKNAYAVEEIKVGENGYAQIAFKMPETKDGASTDGEYIMYVKENGKEKAVYEFEFISQTTKAQVRALLKSSTADDMKALLAADSAYRSAIASMGIDFDIYDSLGSGANDVCNEYAETAKTEDNAADLLKRVIGAAAINGGKNSEAVLDMVNPTYKGVSYSEITDGDLKTYIINYMKNNASEISAETFDDDYARANVLYTINNAKYNELDSLMSANEKLLGLDDSKYSNYLKLTDSKKTETCENMVRKLKSSPATSVSAFKTILANSITGGTSTGGTSGGTSGGGSGTSSSSGSTASSSTSSAVVSVVTPVVEDLTFSDMNSAAWATDAVEKLFKKGIVSGVNADEFQPNRNITREEFVTMLVRAYEINTDGENIFEDVSANAWYAKYVNAAYRSGIAFGVSETEFGVGTLLTRQDMMTMAARIAPDNKTNVRSISEINDFDTVSDYAKESVKELYEAGVVSGMGEGLIMPHANTTRAEAAQILYKILGL